MLRSRGAPTSTSGRIVNTSVAERRRRNRQTGGRKTRQAGLRPPRSSGRFRNGRRFSRGLSRIAATPGRNLSRPRIARTTRSRSARTLYSASLRLVSRAKSRNFREGSSARTMKNGGVFGVLMPRHDAHTYTSQHLPENVTR